MGAIDLGRTMEMKVNKQNKPRDVAHLFFARHLGEGTIGCVFMSVLCNKNWG